ncbi:hypothetical protein ACTHGU_21505 [Chitinophagaceae bacterium MMS25-I14]
MKSNFLRIIFILACASCTSAPPSQSEKNDKQQNAINKTFAGDSVIRDKAFIAKIDAGGEYIFNQFIQVVTNNKNRFSSDTQRILSFAGGQLQLVQKVNDKENVQTIFYIEKNNLKTDSILFYKYQFDKNVPGGEQRFEVLSYLEDDLTLWHLETFTNHSEDAIGISEWSKYRIDTASGKIVLIAKNMDFGTNDTERSLSGNDFIGKYKIDIIGEQTTDGVSNKTYFIDVNVQSAEIKIDAFHEPDFCQGRYDIREKDGVLQLFYDGDDSGCINNDGSANFLLKHMSGETFIKSSLFNAEHRDKWLRLTKK